LTSTGGAAGFLNGVIDEARIWNRARTQTAIADSMFLEAEGAPGLLGRWGLNEGSGTTAANSVAGGTAGTLTGAPSWMPGSPFEIHNALRLGASNAYVTFGDAAALDLAQFTLETWFRRDGAGTAASTGSGGVTALPLITKGAAEIDGDNRDMNYFLGIRGSDNVLVADFEEGPGGSGPQGLNHPVAGITPIVTGTWYHAAVTYDGTTWKLYLNGNPETELLVGQPVQAASIQHAGLGTTLNSIGTASGYFNGTLDEVRIWNVVRTGEEIAATVNQRISSAASNLVARWGLDEWKGSTVSGTAGTSVHGTATGNGWSWAGPAPFNAVVAPPAPPAAPGDPQAVADTHAQIRVTWTDNSDNEIEFQLDRSVNGFAGAYTLLATLPPNTSAYLDWNLTAGAQYCYRVRASNQVGDSDYSYPVCATTPLDPEAALTFGGTDARVAFGDPAALDLAQFTLETWFRRAEPGLPPIPGAVAYSPFPW
jgi:hypothetical protein